MIRLLRELEKGERRRVKKDRDSIDAQVRNHKLVVYFCKLGEECTALHVL